MYFHIFEQLSRKITASIKIKINLLITTMVLISILIITIIFSRIYSKTMIKQTTTSSINKLQLISNNINLLTTSIENYAHMIITSQQMQNIINDDVSSSNQLQHLNNINNLKGTFSNLIARDDIINSIIILNLKDGFIYDIGGNTSDMQSNHITNTLITNRLLDEKEHYIWTDVHKSPFKVSSRSTYIFTLYESIMNMDTGYIDGIIAININESAISSILSHDLGKTGEFFMLNPQGHVMASSNSKQLISNISDQKYYTWCKNINEGGDIITINGIKHLVVTYVTKNNWRLIGSVPLREILPSSSKINTYIFIISIIIFVITSIISLFLSRRIIAPFLHLASLMKKTGTCGNLNLRVDEKLYKDETRVLVESYNSMMSRIRTLINQVKEEQRMKRKYEICLIHSQIKPHFLYNSLNTICGLMCIDDYQKALHMTQCLGQFYKLSLDTENTLVRIEEEIKLIKSYVGIQQISYGDSLTFFTDIDDSILSTYIPKFLLQPLVENAFKHGFCGMKEHDLVLCISGKRLTQYIELCVSDNGKGNDPKFIKSLFSDTCHNLGHFGLHSIDAMLRFHYSDTYTLKCDTEVDKGMRITILLPIGKESYNDKSSIS